MSIHHPDHFDQALLNACLSQEYTWNLQVTDQFPFESPKSKISSPVKSICLLLCLPSSNTWKPISFVLPTRCAIVFWQWLNGNVHFFLLQLYNIYIYSSCKFRLNDGHNSVCLICMFYMYRLNLFYFVLKKYVDTISYTQLNITILSLHISLNRLFVKLYVVNLHNSNSKQTHC